MRQAGTAPATGTTIYCPTSLWCTVIYKLLVLWRVYKLLVLCAANSNTQECCNKFITGLLPLVPISEHLKLSNVSPKHGSHYQFDAAWISNFLKLKSSCLLELVLIVTKFMKHYSLPRESGCPAICAQCTMPLMKPWCKRWWTWTHFWCDCMHVQVGSCAAWRTNSILRSWAIALMLLPFHLLGLTWWLSKERSLTWFQENFLAEPMVRHSFINTLLMTLCLVKESMTPRATTLVQVEHLHLDVNNDCNCKMNSMDVAHQLRNIYRMDHWLRQSKWWQHIILWGLQ